MKNLYYFGCLFLIFLACQEKNTRQDISNQTNIPKIDTISYELKSISKEFGDCDASNARCVKATTKYILLNDHPAIAHRAINNTLENSLKGNAPTISAALDSFLTEAKAFFEEFPNVPTGYGMELTQSAIWNTPTILSIEEFNYTYTGGAHGNYGSVYYNFNTVNGQLIQLKDILIEDYELPLKAIAESIFKETYLEKGMTNYSEAGFYFEEDRFKMANNFALTKEGLKFLYNPYEIAPYAMGQQEILIPYAALAPLLKPNGLLKNSYQ